MLLILFGLSGSGKNFTGEILEREFGYHFWDADTEIPSDMQKQIADKKIFTQEMRNKFTETIINKINLLQQHFENVVVAQALYKNLNRNQIARAYPGAHFLLIEASKAVILDRIQIRNNQVDQDYAEKMAFHFEYPQHSYTLIKNDSDETAIIAQIQRFLDLNAGQNQ